MFNQVLVNPPSTTSNADGQQVFQLGGKQGDGIVSELHGKWFTQAYRGRVFTATPLIAGVTIPVNTTTAPTWTLFNPLGSGVNVELISFDYGFPAAAASVAGTILASYSTQTPTAVTALTPSSAIIGAGSVPQAKVYTAATITAITTHIPLFTITGTSDVTDGATHYDFDGKMILAPGALVTITSTPVQTAVGLPCWFWAESPV